MKLNGYFQIQ